MTEKFDSEHIDIWKLFENATWRKRQPMDQRNVLWNRHSQHDDQVKMILYDRGPVECYFRDISSHGSTPQDAFGQRPKITDIRIDTSERTVRTVQLCSFWTLNVDSRQIIKCKILNYILIARNETTLMNM